MAGGVPKRQFNRESISMSTPDVKKAWQEVEVQVLVRGDTVRGYGTISWIEHGDFGDTIAIRWVNEKTSLFTPYDIVTAFTAVV